MEDSPVITSVLNTRRCQFCPATFVSTIRLVRHANKLHHHLIVNQWLPCLKCPLLYPSKTSLKGHVTGTHVRKRGKKFESEITDEQIVQCKFCSKSFKFESSMITHCKADHRDLVEKHWLKCDTCQLPQFSEAALNHHRKSCEKNFKKKSQFTKFNPTCQLYTCQFCNAKLKTSGYYFSHSNQQHFNEISSIWIPCKLCDTYRPDEASLQRHNKISHANELQKNGSHVCQYCSVTFVRISNFYKHVNINHQKEILRDWFPCNHCSNFFPSEKVLNHHKSGKHGGHFTSGRDILCQICPRSFMKSTQYYKHCNEKHKTDIQDKWLACVQCQWMLPTSHALQNHVSSSHGNATNPSHPFQCGFCTWKYSNRSKYYKHVNSEHKSEASTIWLTCKYCPKLVPDSKSLKRHTLGIHKIKIESTGNEISTKDKLAKTGGAKTDREMTSESGKKANLFLCEFCSKSLTTKSGYCTHVNFKHKSSASSSWLTCVHCSYLLPDEKTLKNHCNVSHIHITTSAQPIKHRDKRKRSSANTKDILDEGMRNICEYCSKPNRTKKCYYKHVNENHKTEASSTWLTCSTCSYLLPDRQTLKHHCSGSHYLCHLAIKCSDCKLTFKRKTEYYTHANKMHNNIVAKKWIKCVKCKFYLPNQNSLSKHQEQSCIVLKFKSGTPECQFCPKSFSDTLQYYQHVNTEHRDAAADTWLLCQECAKFYPTEGILNSHIASAHAKSEEVLMMETFEAYEMIDKTEDNIATGDDLKTCIDCPVICVTIQDYYDHMNNFHFESVKGTWSKCPDCPKYFPKAEALISHIKDDHSDFPPDVEDGGRLKCPECSTIFEDIRNLFSHAARSHYMDQMIGLYQTNFLLTDGICKLCPRKVELGNLKKYVRHMGGSHRLFAKFMTPEMAKNYSSLPTTLQQNEELKSIVKLFDATETNPKKKFKGGEMAGNIVRINILAKPKVEVDESDQNSKFQMEENNISDEDPLGKTKCNNSKFENAIFCLLCLSTMTMTEFSNITKYKQHLAIDHFKQQIFNLHLQTLAISGSGFLLCYICKKQQGAERREFKTLDSLVIHLGSKHNCILDFVEDDLKAQLREVGVVKYPVNIVEDSVLRLIKNNVAVNHEEIAERLFS